MVTKRMLNTSGVETIPLHRVTHDIQDDILDMAMGFADDALRAVLTKYQRPSQYILYSLTLFYEDEETDPRNYVGFQATYHCHTGPEVTVQQYQDQTFVQNMAQARACRQIMGISRYRLFLRYITTKEGLPRQTWYYSHAGQLPTQVSIKRGIERWKL